MENRKTKSERIAMEISQKIDEFYDAQEPEEFVPGKSKVPLSYPSYGKEEVREAMDSILSGWVTMGKKVKLFEELYAKYIGMPSCVMVNSGSSANLLALSVLASPKLKNHVGRGDEIITPAVTWATSVSPISQIGAVPHLVDVDLETYNMNLEQVEKSITKKTKAIMAVHLLGNPCDMKLVMEIAERHGLYVIEDTCESHGAETSGRKCGSFGDFSTFSFFFAHHISTVEGGAVLTRNEELNEICRSMRAYGWIRDMANKEQYMPESRMDEKFTFAYPGYNFRPTDINAAFGIHQIKKIESFIEKRGKNAEYLAKRLAPYSDFLHLLAIKPGTRCSWFGYPITLKPNAGFSRDELRNFLEARGIETRPIMTGDITRQPMMKHIAYEKENLATSDYLTANSFFIGVHQNLPANALEYVAESFEVFFRGRKKE
ncbi:MAG: aminotransferase class I/II-fold pyridoxal phosphate-dependent enzyme [Candidatus Micrarchaeia archaeon]